jgi:hypothetical protein
VSDSAKRLKEWIHFHLMVGVDHIVIYDNTDTATLTTTNNNNDKDNHTNHHNTGGKEQLSELRAVVDSFSPQQLTYHAWPCKICNNNRPAHKNPGERSSQYAAEASCRTRYGELTDWMTFIDSDEYLVRNYVRLCCVSSNDIKRGRRLCFQDTPVIHVPYLTGSIVCSMCIFMMYRSQ